LLIGSLPLFIGLAVVMPVLGHSSWHLYRKVVAPDPNTLHAYKTDAIRKPVPTQNLKSDICGRDFSAQQTTMTSDPTRGP
jgi:hypothetical protein